MTAIIYEGVGGGGRLFEDIKLFIMQRVPLRDTWKKLVEDNGGEVVKIDTQADYIIADHARRDCPAGSLSWKWIDQCVKDGQLVDMENYRAGPAEKSIREVGSGQPTRSGRTPFSVEDDRILMEWVTRAERQGVSTKGNELYKQLEQKNNRHTFQSWRDRWIKYLSHRPRPNHDHGDESPPPEPTFVPSRRTVSRPTAAVPSPRSPIQASSSRTTSRRLPVSVEVPSEENAHEFVAKSKGGNHFSKSERELLINTYDDIMDINDDQIINAWSVWAVKYPNHTAQEWRNYFTKKVIPRMEELRKEEEDDDNSTEPEPEEPMLPSRVERSSASRPKPASSNRPPSNAIEIKDSQGSSGKTIDSSSARKPLPDPVLEKEELFEAKMKEVADALNIESELDFMPSICGRHISLWSLYRVVVSDQFGGSDEVTGRYRWPEVASKLNFNAFQHKTAAEELKACYEQVLSDFEGFRVDYLQENPDLTESQEADTSQLIEDQLMQTATRESFEMDHADEDEDDDDDDLDQPPSSTPRPASPSKRGFVVDRINDRTPSKKRPRLDKGKGREIEIPSTPEEIFNGTQAARPLKPSPLKVSTVMYPDLEPEEDDNDRSSNVPSARETYRPSSSRQPPRHPEPETQDFHFPAEEPEQNNNSWISSSPPPRPQPRGLSPEESTQSQNDSKDPITAFIDYWTALAYPSELVIQALEATTMETQDAPYVMEQLTGGAGIPDDMEGVWTGEDDEALGAEGDTEEFRKVLGKHGQARVAKRMQYLREKAEVDDEDEDE